MTANFVPVRRLISSITNASEAVVTTSENHGYESNQWVRLVVPLSYGMRLNYVQTLITVTSDTQFRTTVDTTQQAAFVEPSPPFTQAQVIPISQTTDVVDP